MLFYVLFVFELFYVLFVFVLFYVLFVFVLFYVLFVFVLFYVLFVFQLFYVLFVFGPPLWSSGQSFWLQIQRSRVRFPALPDFLSSSGSGTGSTQPREVN